MHNISPDRIIGIYFVNVFINFDPSYEIFVMQRINNDFIITIAEMVQAFVHESKSIWGIY